MSLRHHQVLRLLALITIVVSLVYVAERRNWRRDVTAEGLSELAPRTLEIIDGAAEGGPVVITAYVSDEVPRQYVAVRERLLNILEELDARGGEAIELRLHAPQEHSEEGQEAVEQFGIEPRAVLSSEGGRLNAMPVFLGVAFQSGPREEVIEFIDRGLSVEYELARALRAVTSEDRRVVGIVRNDTQLTGGFDFAAGGQIPEWRIVEELRKQYEVRSVDPALPVADDIDVLLVPQVSSLSQAALDNVAAHVRAGKPSLLVADPMPAFDVRLAPTEPMLPPPGAGQMGMLGGPQGEPKGDYGGFLRSVGVDWAPSRVVFDHENPNPQMESVPPHIVFVGQRSDGSNPLAVEDPVVGGLAQVVTMYAGQLRRTELSGLEFTPLLTTGVAGGHHEFRELVPRNPFAEPRPGPGRLAGAPVVMAARVRRAGEGTSDDPSLDAIVVADLDVMSDSFFSFHERGGDLDGDGLIDIRLDNVTFVLNAIDSLAGDEDFIELRKRQPRFRRLDTVDGFTARARTRREEKIVEADEAAEAALEDAKANLRAAVDRIRAREELDATTRETLVEAAEDVENRKLALAQERIEREKARTIAGVEKEHLREVDQIQNRIRVAAILLPPVPALLLGLLIFGRKRRRERASIPARRKRGAA